MIKLNSTTYYEKNKTKILEYQKKYYEINKKKILEKEKQKRNEKTINKTIENLNELMNIDFCNKS